MNIITGDMWSIFSKTDHFIFTGNAFIKRNGALVMGRGIARVVRDRWQGIDVILGNAVKRSKDAEEFYGLILGKKLGVFQVKWHWNDDADLDLIARSVELLRVEAESHTDQRYDMNMPGIGNGHLPYDSVLPLLHGLPDNVFIWKFK